MKRLYPGGAVRRVIGVSGFQPVAQSLWKLVAGVADVDDLRKVVLRDRTQFSIIFDACQGELLVFVEPVVELQVGIRRPRETHTCLSKRRSPSVLNRTGQKSYFSDGGREARVPPWVRCENICLG